MNHFCLFVSKPMAVQVRCVTECYVWLARSLNHSPVAPALCGGYFLSSNPSPELRPADRTVAASLSGSGVAPILQLSASPAPVSGVRRRRTKHAQLDAPSSFSGFNVYRSTVSGGPYTKLDSSIITTDSYTGASVTNGPTYHYVATEVDTSDNESTYSTQVSATIP